MSTTLDKIKNLAENELELFDSMPPEVRKVIREHSCPVNLLALFDMAPLLHRMAIMEPAVFAEKLGMQLDVWQGEYMKRNRAAIEAPRAG